MSGRQNPGADTAGTLVAGQLSRHGDRRDWISNQGLQLPRGGAHPGQWPPTPRLVLRTSAADARPPEPQGTPDHTGGGCWLCCPPPGGTVTATDTYTPRLYKASAKGTTFLQTLQCRVQDLDPSEKSRGLQDCFSLHIVDTR